MEDNGKASMGSVQNKFSVKVGILSQQGGVGVWPNPNFLKPKPQPYKTMHRGIWSMRWFNDNNAGLHKLTMQFFGDNALLGDGDF